MRVLSVQSQVVYGHVGNSAAVLPLQLLGHEVWPVPTVLFSNHPAHAGWRGRVLPAAEVEALLRGVAERGALDGCDAVLSGYLGEPATGDLVADAVVRVKAARPAALYCCDPVIGEAASGVYVRPGVPEVIARRLLPLADLVTPNAFELAWLTGRAPDSLEAGLGACDALRERGPRVVVATGLALPEAPGDLTVLAVTTGGAWAARTPRRGVAAHGAGDLFAALLLGAYLRRADAAAALAHAVAAVDATLAETAARGGDHLALVAAREALVAPPPLRVDRLR
jgi:pyridoxine kinase